MGFLKTTRQKKAVAGYRHSAEDKQENSVPLQREFIREFARKHNIEIIHEEADEGVSGLTANRPGFRRLFDDWILNPKAPPFDYVLVYDVSRWGRFEDADEAGYYEFQCRQMGKEVVYARRGFPETEEQRGMFQVQTSFERWMSFQYSKKLSEDVIRGCLEISSQGYSVGGQAPYGMARMLLSAGDRKPIRIMLEGEHKSVANERITFVPKEDSTTDTVRRIFIRLLDGKLNPAEIADELNREEILSPGGSLWNKGSVHRILTNPVYKGTLIYNKTWGRLKRKKRHNPVADWVIYPDAFPAIIEAERFDAAQEQIYWLYPSNYRRAHIILNRTKKSVRGDVRFILEKNNFSGEMNDAVPIVFAVKRYTVNRTAYWCFILPRKLERFSAILCISVETDAEDSIERKFVIPRKAFSLNGMCFLSESDVEYNEWLCKEVNIEATIVSLAYRK
jgi:DNA invertase Pin-like site-specific DNA recombinase